MRKIFGVLLSVLCICCAAIGLTGCKKDKHIHAFDKQVVTDEYKATDATCTEAATYYYSCSCGEKGTETFTSGNALGHSFTNYVSDNNATCTQDGTKTAKCDRCDETDTVKDINSKLNHSYTEQIVSDEYLAAPATCNKKATYYYSCVCGEKGTETFEYGSTTNHNFVNGSCTYCGKKQETSRGLAFRLLDDGTYEVSGIGSCTDTEIVIPSVYNDKPVTSIGKGAFRGCSGLTSVTIPDRVTSIGGGAFYYCSGLTSVTIPDSVTSIGDGAFDGCYKLVEVINKSGLNITKGSGIAYYALNVKKDGTSDIVNKDGYLFYTYDNVNYLLAYVGSNTDLTLPDDYNGENYKLNNCAFDGCSGLTSVTIPDSVNSIGWWAFRGCSGLTSVTIGNSVTSIGISAFDGCSGLTSVTIPDRVTYIGEQAFNGCSGLTRVTIGNSVTSIGWWAFEGCSGLTSVTIPDSVTSIGSGAFRYCRGLTSVTIGSSVTSIGGGAFWSCCKLVEVINKSALNIKKGQYSENGDIACYALNVKKDGTSDIVNKDDYLFYTVEGTHYLVGYVGNDVILTLPESYNGKSYEMNLYAFYGCSGLTSVTIPNSVTSFGDSAFSGCSGLTSVIIPNSVTSIGNSAFYNCRGLTSVTISDGVTSIGYGAFENCSGLTSVTIPNSVTSFGDSAFSGCSSLTSVTIPDSVTSIGKLAFSGCSGIESLVVTAGNKKYHSANNCIIETETKQLIVGCKTSIIPSDGSVTSIGDGAFYGCSGLTSVTIPDSVTSIGHVAFYGCSGLTSVTIPDSVGNSAFEGCSGLTSVTIGNSVTSIGCEAFRGCSGLTSVTIGNSVISIGNSAFWGCYKLVEVINKSTLNIEKGSGDNGHAGYYALNVKTSGETDIVNKDGYLFYTYDNVNYLVAYVGSNTDLILPDDYNGQIYKLYKRAFDGCSGLTSVTIPDSVTSIGDWAFEGCSGLASVTIGNRVTSIGNYAFSGCSGIESLVVTAGNKKYHSANNCIIETGTKQLIVGCKTSIIPSDGSVTSIGEGAFDGCSGLTSVTIPDSVTSIGRSAFEGCSGLTSVTIGNSVISIGNSAFDGCSGLTSITYKGTIADWKNIDKGIYWKFNVPTTCVIHCTDGVIGINE